MNDRTPEAGHDGPRVIVAQRVIDKIVSGAVRYPELETGEALIGLIVPQSDQPEPDIYVLDTIGAGEQAVREWGMFEHGSDWQGDVLHWLHVNWEAFRDLRRGSYGNALAAKWDVPLMHVGDWHKQPGDMIEPSSGDARTARRMIADSETPVKHVVAPIVTLYRLHPLRDKEETPAPSSTPEKAASAEAAPAEETADVLPGEGAEETPPAEDTVESKASPALDKRVVEMPPVARQAVIVPVPDQGWMVRIDFWYISQRLRRFVAMTPEVWPDDRLPGLPRLGWHLAHPRRFEQEYDLLTSANYDVDVVRWDADGKPPYEICFAVHRPDSPHVILLVTSADYPTQIPAVRIAPLVSVEENEDMFEKLYEVSEPMLTTDMPDWRWDSKRTLLELVWHIEEKRGKKETTA